MGLRVRVEILGAFQLFVEDRYIEVSRDQVRDALVLLAARVPQPVSRDQLIEHLWADRLPTDPQASLRVALSRVRQALGDASGCLQSHQHGYSLQATTDAIDFFDLLEAAGSASADQAVELRSQALGMFTQPRPHLADAPLLQSFLGGVQRAHAAVLVQQVETLARLGRHADVIEYSRTVLDEAKGDERMSVLAAQALAATGAKAAALEVMASCRRFLRDELGLDPGDEFSRVESSIIRDATGLRRPDVAAGSVGRLEIPFVGRVRELDYLESVRGGLWTLIGEAGSGKTALINQLEKRLTGGGRSVIHVRATQTPTRPMETLSALLVGIASTIKVADRDETLRSVLSRLAPEESHADAKPPGSRDALLLLAASALKTHAAATDVVFLVDDAQWLDRSSAHVIEGIAESGTATMIVTARDAIPEQFGFLQGTGDFGATLQLGPLSKDDIAHVVATELPNLPATLTVERLHRQSGGNALFLQLLVDLLAEGSLPDGLLPPSILVSVRRRVESLSTAAQRTLEIASVFNEAFSLDTLSEIDPGASTHIHEAIREGLVVPTGIDGDYRFAHALVADGAYQLLSDGYRVELHDEIGRSLEAAGASAAEYALHCSEAAVLDPSRALVAHLRAAAEFALAFDWDTALLHAERGLRVLGDFDLDDGRARGELLIIAGTAFIAQGSPQGDQLLIEGVDLALAEPDSTVAVSGILALCTHGRMSTDDGPAVYELVRRALDGPLTTDQKVQVLAAESTLLAVSSLQARANRAFREAFDLLPSCTSRAARREVLLRTHLGFPHPADFGRRVEATSLLADLSENDPDLQWEVAFLQFGNAMVRGDHAAAAERISTMRDFTPHIRERKRDFGLCFGEASWARFNNDLQEAERLLDEAMVIGQDLLGDEWPMMIYFAITTSIREAQGRLHELMPLIDRSIAADPEWPTWHVLAAAGAASAGRLDRAAEEMVWLKRDEFGCLWPDVSWPAMFSFLTEPVSLLADHEAAAMLLKLIEPHAGLNLWNGACVHQSADAVITKFRAVSTGLGA